MLTIQPQLTQLETAGLIRLAQTEPDLEYLFRHALVQDAAYGSILKADRKFIHRRIAETLEHLYPEQRDPLALVLGGHWREAGESNHAREYFIRAAEFARQQYANAEAIAAYTQALALTAEAASQFDLLAARVAVYDITAMRAEQRADVDEMLALAETLNDDTRRCEALITLAEFYLKTEHLQSRAPAERALALAQTLGDRQREGRAWRNLGEGAFNRRDYADSRRQLEAALVCFRAAGQPLELAAGLNELALVLGELNELTAAQQAAEEAAHLSHSAGDKRAEAVSLRRLAIVHANQKDFAKARPHAEAALALNRQLGDRANESHTLNVLGTIHAALGEVAQAFTYYTTALDLADAIQLQFGARIMGYNLVELWRSVGEHQTAVTFLDTRMALAQRAQDEYLQTECQAKQAHLYAELGQYARACALWQTALANRQKMGRSIEGALANISRMEALLGQAAEAQQDAARVWAMAQASGQPYLVALAQADLAFISELIGDEPTQRAALAQVEQAIGVLAHELNPVPAVNAYITAARLCLKLGAPEQALAHSSQAARLVSANSDVGEMEQPFWIHALALRANGRAAEADEFLRRAYERVQLVANNLSDAELRRSWLENVRDNRDIVAAWKALKH
jgi:tetratricopeptide (TPR) repeat protein